MTGARALLDDVICYCCRKGKPSVLQSSTSTVTYLRIINPEVNLKTECHADNTMCCIVANEVGHAKYCLA